MVESTQIRWLSRGSGEGGCSGRTIAQRRPRVSKLGLKGLSFYHSNETAVEAARWEPAGGIKRATLTECLFKKRELDNSWKPNQTKAQGNPPEKNNTDKKDLLTLTLSNVAEGR